MTRLPVGAEPACSAGAPEPEQWQALAATAATFCAPDQALLSLAVPVALLDAHGAMLAHNHAFAALFDADPPDDVFGALIDRAVDRNGTQLAERVMRAVDCSGRWIGELRLRTSRRTRPVILTAGMLPGFVTSRATRYLLLQDLSDVEHGGGASGIGPGRDALTELPTRDVLRQRLLQALTQAARRNQRLALLFLDVDHFKLVNDSIGHPAGDALLQLVALRMRASMREADLVARFGGDEFVVVIEDLHEPIQAARAAERLLGALTKPFPIDGRELYTTSSVGISLYPEDGEDVDALLRCADAALYRAKERGRNQYQFYAADMGRRALESLDAPSDLRRALLRGEFMLHYQPVVGVETGRVAGYEALVRWRHPVRGTLLPDVFIGQAEKHGLIDDVFDWVLGTGAAELARRLGADRKLRLAVNLSPSQLRRRGLAARIADCLARHRLPPSCCEVEITENTLVHCSADVLESLHELGGLGVQVALDDFGTGYSSLGYLKDLPISRLKVDRCFVSQLVTDPRSNAIVRAMVAIAHGLGLGIVAEGVETEDQLAGLRSLGCDEAQGYLFSEPVPASLLAPPIDI